MAQASAAPFPPFIAPPFTAAVRDALDGVRDAALVADLLFLEAWEMRPSMDLGATLRASQIRRANPALAAAISRELKAARIWRPPVKAA